MLNKGRQTECTSVNVRPARFSTRRNEGLLSTLLIMLSIVLLYFDASVCVFDVITCFNSIMRQLGSNWIPEKVQLLRSGS